MTKLYLLNLFLASFLAKKMHRARSARSDASDADIDGFAEREQELQRLLRQLRLMDGDRKAYCLESQDLIKKQK